MSNTIHTLIDTAGEPWHVCPGDPAHALCDRLTRQGWAVLRLPGRVIAEGYVDEADCQQAEAALAAVEEALADEPSPDPATDAILLDAFEAWRQIVSLSGVQE